MTREEYIDFANALKNNYTIDFDKLPEFCDMAISALSTDVSPNIHGHWKKAKKGITAGELSNLFKCSCCNYELYDDEFNFCPNCGADMRPEPYKKGE